MLVLAVLAVAGLGGVALSGGRTRAAGSQHADRSQADPSAAGSPSSHDSADNNHEGDSRTAAARRDALSLLERFSDMDADGGAQPTTTVQGAGVSAGGGVGKRSLESARAARTLKRLRELGYARVHVLVATVPDPEDSRYARLFDDLVSAIRTGLEASGFIDDRFSDPWRADAGAGEVGLLRREQPAALLFRRAEKGELLLLLLVGETPARGVHKRALRNALDVAHAIITESARADAHASVAAPAGAATGAAAKRTTLAMLAPTLSGTTESLRIALSDWCKTLPSTEVEGQARGREASAAAFEVALISGSATSDGNRSTLGADLTASVGTTCPGFKSSFQATVHAERDRQTFVIDTLVNDLKLTQLAVLAESSTTYGKGVAGSSSTSRIAHQKEQHFRIVNLPFPLHVSKLRNVYERHQAETAAANTGDRQTRLQLERVDGGKVDEDAFPAKSRLTQSASEISLEQTLHAIATEGIQAVIIAASSTADVLFLVEKVRQSFPNVTIVVNDADLIYLHDDVPFMEGVLVASTYPLLPWSQRMTFPFKGDERRLFFPSSAAEGAYNATLLLLDGISTAKLVDFGPPFTASAGSTQPTLWMTVVSRGAFWPLSVSTTPEKSAYVRVAPAEPKHRDADGDAKVARVIWTPPRSFVFRLANLLLGLLDVLLAWGYVRGQTSPKGQDGRSAGRVTGLFLRPGQAFPHIKMQSFECAGLLFTALLISAGFFAVGVISLAPNAANVPVLERTLTSLFGAMTVVMLGLTVHALLLLSPVKGWWAVALAAVAALGAALAVACVAERGVAALREGRGSAQVMFLAERARNLDSGVSLLWMGLVVGAGYALWILGHLRQVRIVEDAASLRRFGVIPAAVDPHAEPSLLDKLQLGEPMRAAIREAEGVSPNASSAILMLIVGGAALWVSRRLTFFESWIFGGAGVIAYAGLLAVMVYGCARYLRTWRALEEVLARVAPRSVTVALARIPAELLTSFKRPWDAYVFDVWQQHCQAVLARIRETTALLAPSATALGMKADDLEALLVAPVPVLIDGSERHPLRPSLDGEASVALWEEFLAMRLVAFVHYIRTHLANFVAVSTAVLLPALWATNFYPLRENRFLLMLVLVVATAVIAVTAAVFVQMKRNYVLGKMYRTPNGQVVWDKAFVSSLLVHVALPLLAVLAVKFPELGRGWGALMTALSTVGLGGS